MTRYIDRKISSLPIRLTSLNIDPAKLRMQGLMITETGHLPGRYLFNAGVSFLDWAVAYIVNGKGTYQVDNGPVHTIGPGSVFFVWPGAKFHYGPSSGDLWEEYYITFRGHRVDELLRYECLHRGKVLQVGTDDSWARKIEQIATLIESGAALQIDRASQLLETLLLEFAYAEDGSSADAAQDQWIRIQDDLGGQIYRTFHGASTAARLNISVSTLRRIIKERTGYPLNDYVHRIKMSEAKNILINTSKTVTEISLSLGYTDVYYFSRLFSKYTGLPPREFRRIYAR